MGSTLILYGSETGMSEELAQKLSYKLHHSQIPHVLASFDEMSLQKFEKLYTSTSETKLSNIIIVSSTTGQGELPSFIKKSALWQFLKRKDLSDTFFNGINFYFLGIGDSLYVKFQHAIRLLKLRFIDRLGGNFKHKIEIDVSGMRGNGSVEAAFPEFVKLVKQEISGSDNLNKYIDDKVYIPIGPVLSIQEGDDNNNCISVPIELSEEWIKSSVISNTRITSKDHFQDVRSVLIKNNKKFKPGDTISIMPNNQEHSIDEFIKLQPHLKPFLNKKFNIEGYSESITLYDLIKTRLDINSVPRRFFFMKIWNFQETDKENELEVLEQHKQKLYEFGHADDDYDYLDYVYRPRRSILEILYDFHYIKLPLEYLLDIIPTLRSRQYSISNSCFEGNTDIELTVAVLEYETLLFKKREGLCSNYIKNLKANQSINFQINSLNLFEKIEPFVMEGVEDILLISPGVGIAPIKSFIMEQDYKDFNKTLYFGSRYSSKDKLYGSLLTSLSDDPEYNLIYKCCHSRDTNNIVDGIRIKYVQDLLWKDSENVFDMIFNKKCIIYLCGSAGQMPTQVRMTVEAILNKHGVPNSDKYVSQLIKEDRFIQETW
ncbi:hypothetical protein QEN19_003761 [Hanseniaspora menglaensis]